MTYSKLIRVKYIQKLIRCFCINCIVVSVPLLMIFYLNNYAHFYGQSVETVVLKLFYGCELLEIDRNDTFFIPVEWLISLFLPLFIINIHIFPLNQFFISIAPSVGSRKKLWNIICLNNCIVVFGLWIISLAIVWVIHITGGFFYETFDREVVRSGFINESVKNIQFEDKVFIFLIPGFINLLLIMLHTILSLYIPQFWSLVIVFLLCFYSFYNNGALAISKYFMFARTDIFSITGFSVKECIVQLLVSNCIVYYIGNKGIQYKNILN